MMKLLISKLDSTIYSMFATQFLYLANYAGTCSFYFCLTLTDLRSCSFWLVAFLRFYAVSKFLTVFSVPLSTITDFWSIITSATILFPLADYAGTCSFYFCLILIASILFTILLIAFCIVLNRYIESSLI